MTDRQPSAEQRRSELTEIRRELRDKQPYLDDNEELWLDISRWLMQSYDVPVGSLRTNVRSRMAELQEDPQHRMYDHADVDTGEEAFPDDCKGCPHYGTLCPVLAQHFSKRTFERIFDEADDEDELQGRLSEFAAKNHCHVLQNTISEWETGYAKFLSEGERLRFELNADIKGIDIDEMPLDPEEDTAGSNSSGEEAASTPRVASEAGTTPTAGTALDGSHGAEGMPEEAAERAAAVKEAIAQDDAEEEEANS